MPSEPHLSGPAAGTTICGECNTRSGSPIVHLSLLAKSRAGGMSAGLPRGAPASTHFAIVAISSSLSDGSSLNFWMPMFFSTNHGGMTPAREPRPVRVLIARDHGRTSSYVVSGIGATPLELWQCWQLRCRMGATSLVKVTSPPDPVWAAGDVAIDVVTIKATPTLGTSGAILIAILPRVNPRAYANPLVTSTN